MTRSTSSSLPVPAPATHGLRGGWNRLAEGLSRLGDGLPMLATRAGLAAVFWQSGRTKVEGLLTVTDSAIELFREEYRLPLLPPEIGTHLAAYAEHALPLLLLLGLFTRGAALGLLAMTTVIQTFVYPDAWPTHLSWAGPLLWLVVKGPGPWSVDHRIGLR
jgi:putative oxidoreductase